MTPQQRHLSITEQLRKQHHYLEYWEREKLLQTLHYLEVEHNARSNPDNNTPKRNKSRARKPKQSN